MLLSQLGLTFTVPFLSIPLSGLTDLVTGAGDSIGDLFGGTGFDTSNIIFIVVLALGAIFVLPQLLYWLTGVNLSAFNWGRSDDPNYLADLTNTVDRALSDYDIDLRQCAASIMCKEMKRRGKKLDGVQGKEEGEGEGTASSVTDMIGYGIMRQAAK